MINQIEIQRLTATSDKSLFRDIARIHQEEITEGFLSVLGSDFLEKLYSFIASSRHSFLLAATLEGRAIGFICGSTTTRGLYGEFIWKHGWKVLPLVLSKVISFDIILKIKETLCYPLQQKCQDLPPSEILNFCVSRTYQRQGIAKLLFQRLTEEFKRLHINKIKIVTGEQQISAQKFYEAMHAEHVSNISIHHSIVSHIFIYTIS